MEQKSNNVVNPEDEYGMLGEVEHVIQRPDMYIGSTTIEDKLMSIVEFLPNNEFRIVEKTVKYIEGMERVFLEILSNAADNARRSRDLKIPVGKMEVKVTKDTISIYNEGRPISLQWHSQHKMWIPEMIFFNLRAGSNFNDGADKKWAGRNGLGAKLAGIFSERFSIDLVNTYEGFYYKQTSTDNFSNLHPGERDSVKRNTSKVNPYKGSYTRITWKPDFMKFYCKLVAQNVHKESILPPTEECPEPVVIPAEPLTKDPMHCRLCWEHNKGHNKAVFMDDFVGIMARLSLDFAFNCNVPITFIYDPDEDEDTAITIDFNIDSPLSFAKAYMPELVNIKSAPIIYESADGDTRMVMLDTPYNGKTVSFANAMPTRLGGVHVNEWVNAISAKLKTQLSKKSVVSIGVGDIKRHITIFLSVYVSNPEFDGQTKERLKSPKPFVNVRDQDLKTFMTWQAANAIRAGMENKEKSKIAKQTDGKRKKFINIPNTDDAELAGTTESYQCTAYLVEGLSAKPFWTNGLKYIDNARKTQGCYPMRGKVLNTRKAEAAKLIENKVIGEIKEFLGLEENADYNQPNIRRRLRYGTIVILTDADVDGIHIRGLLINYFSRFKGLMENNVVTSLLTPVITLSRNHKRLLMYSLSEYEKWRTRTPDRDKWKPDYFKGLGSATDQMIKDAFTNPVRQIFECTPEDQDVLELAFGKAESSTDLRKQLYRTLVDLKPIERLNSSQITRVEDMVYEELILYAVCSNRRAIPKMTDGFKDVHGKIIYGAMKDTPGWDGVEEFQGAVKKLTKYRHGPDPLKNAIVNMAAKFPRSNNIPFIEGQGNFGTRIALGHDSSAPRYLSCRPSPILPYMFRKEDNEILTPEIEEGKQTGYLHFLPILPPHLINFSHGIGWGWRCSSVQYNPMQLIEWIKYFVQHVKDGKPNAHFKPPKLLPWWRGYTGVIFRRNDGVAVNRGYCKEEGPYVMVTEIPVNTSAVEYEKELNIMMRENYITEWYPIGIDPNKPEYKLGGYARKRVGHVELRIEDRIPETGMVFLDEHDVPQTYIHGPNEVMAVWCKFRYKKYVERKKVYVQKLEEDLRMLGLRVNFVEDVIAEPPRLEIRNKPRDSYIPYMEQKGYPESFLNMSIKSLTHEKATKLKQEMVEMQLIVDRYKITHPGDLWLQDLEELRVKLEELFPGEWTPPEGYGDKRQPEPPKKRYM